MEETLNTKTPRDTARIRYYIFAAVVLIVGILITMNSYSYKSYSYSLSRDSDTAVEGYTSYSPKLSLTSGEYEINVSGSGEVFAISSDGMVLGSGNAGQTFTITLSKDESMISICTDDGSVSRLDLTSEGKAFSDLYLLAIIIMAALLYVGYIAILKKKITDDNLVFFCLIFAAIAASYPAFTDYVAYGNDLNFHMWRIEGIKDGLLAGQFPVRIDPSMNNGNGYITSIMYPELFLYIPAILRIFGVSAVAAYQTLLVLMNMAAAFITYYSIKGISKSKFAGAAAAVIYTLSVWRLYNLFYRAALGESLAMLFFPLVLWGLYELLTGDAKKWWILALGCTGVIQSHFISCVFAGVLGIAGCVVFHKKLFTEKARLYGLLKFIALTVLLNIWYVIPFVYSYLTLDMNIANKPENTEFYRNATIPAELFNIFNRNFGRSLLIPEDGIQGDMSQSLGASASACLIFAIYHFVCGKKRENVKDKGFLLFTLIFALAVLFMTTTLFPWEILQKPKLMNIIVGTIQFPWRMLSIVSPLVIAAGCIALSVYIPKKYKSAAMAGIVIISILTFIPFGTAYTTENGITVTKGTAVPLDGAPGWDNEYFVAGTDVSELTSGNFSGSTGIKVTDFEKNGTNITAELENIAPSGGWIEVPLLNYPGYKAYDGDGNRLKITNGDNNVVRVKVNSDTDEIKIKYSAPVLYRVGDIITLLTLLALAAMLYLKKKGVNPYEKLKNRGNAENTALAD